MPKQVLSSFVVAVIKGSYYLLGRTKAKGGDKVDFKTDVFDNLVGVNGVNQFLGNVKNIVNLLIFGDKGV